jgi:hypothetical protein
MTRRRLPSWESNWVVEFTTKEDAGWSGGDANGKGEAGGVRSLW